MFNNEYCKVEYIEQEKAVYLMWKQFSSGENYRKPTLYALELLKQNPGSQFIIDARNGFEDDPADVQWGFEILLPSMAQTSCKYVVMIMNEVNDIEGEMDMWTKEFRKYFTVLRVDSLGKALEQLKEQNRSLFLKVVYTIREGQRENFYKAVMENEIVSASRQEKGNQSYDYYMSVENSNQIVLLETWANTLSQQEHLKTAQYERLQKLKGEYVIEIAITKLYC